MIADAGDQSGDQSDATICGGEIAATHVTRRGAKQRCRDKLLLLGDFIVPVPPPRRRKDVRARHAEQAQRSGANTAASIWCTQPSGAWCLYRQTPARATRFGSPDGDSCRWRTSPSLPGQNGWGFLSEVLPRVAIQEVIAQLQLLRNTHATRSRRRLYKPTPSSSRWEPCA